MTDPVAARPDAQTWQEPRGPHLPDVVTRVPVLVWPFVALAVVSAGAWWSESAQQGLAVVDVVRWAIGDSPTVLAPLVGAALFLRHPTALRTLPWLALGALLLATGSLINLADPWLTEALRTLVPPADDMHLTEGVLVTWYYGLEQLIPIAAIAFLARGLASARRFEDVGSSRWLVAAAGLLVATTVLYDTWFLASLPEIYTSVQLAAVIASVAIGIVGILAWVLLTLAALAGRRAGEDPATGWLLAAAAGVASLVVSAAGFGVIVAATVFGGFWEPTTLAGFASNGVLFLASLGEATSWALLVAAFVIGLPAEDGPNDELDDDRVPDDVRPLGPIATADDD